MVCEGKPLRSRYTEKKVYCLESGQRRTCHYAEYVAPFFPPLIQESVDERTGRVVVIYKNEL